MHASPFPMLCIFKFMFHSLPPLGSLSPSPAHSHNTRVHGRLLRHIKASHHSLISIELIFARFSAPMLPLLLSSWPSEVRTRCQRSVPGVWKQGREYLQILSPNRASWKWVRRTPCSVEAFRSPEGTNPKNGAKTPIGHASPPPPHDIPRRNRF